jgi:hypothetical protein
MAQSFELAAALGRYVRDREKRRELEVQPKAHRNVEVPFGSVGGHSSQKTSSATCRYLTGGEQCSRKTGHDRKSPGDQTPDHTPVVVNYY